ncbi:MAG TPA: type II toxin-antitoxin system Phd/YefM family antitoxin [Steroidobacteraceae bacterium]|nr:type II toxin-antitoxin system Phd/YefM family antitoxin [Steroidobacteraceae bacterium]
MDIYNLEMDISVTAFRQRCLELIRQVEKTGRPVTILRRGKPVARLGSPGIGGGDSALSPLAQARAWGGTLLAKPEESALRAGDFEAQR